MGSERLTEKELQTIYEVFGEPTKIIPVPTRPELIAAGEKLMQEIKDRQDQPLDLDAALAIVRRRTPGEWEAEENYLHVFGATAQRSNPFVRCLAHEDAAAIVAAVNNFEAVAERCKRAELQAKGTLAKNLCPDHRDKQAGKSCLACTVETLTRQRDELLAALERITVQAEMTEEANFEGTLCSSIRQANKAIASVKGGVDGN